MHSHCTLPDFNSSNAITSTYLTSPSTWNSCSNTSDRDMGNILRPIVSSSPTLNGGILSQTSLPSLVETLPEFFGAKGTKGAATQTTSTISVSSLTSSSSINQIHSSPEGCRRSYSFIALAERDRKPRPRRRFEEVDRLYACVFPGCGKAYGALNHLNSHIVSKSHGPKRSPQEFQEMRRELKMRQAAEAATSNSHHNYHPYHHNQHSPYSSSTPNSHSAGPPSATGPGLAYPGYFPPYQQYRSPSSFVTLEPSVYHH